MKTFFKKIKFIFTDEVLRKRILFIFFAFLIFRLFSAIPLSMINVDKLKALFENNGLLSMINLFSGGGLSALSIVMLGVMPYITASIIMQLLTMTFPKLKELQQEGGEAGRRKNANYSRLLTIPLAAIQAIGYIALLQSGGINLIENLTITDTAFLVLITVAGSIFLMWLGELITEFGIGNGLSLIIFAGILSVLPGKTKFLYDKLSSDTTLIPMYIGILAAFILMIYAIVYVTEAERPVVVHQARASRAGARAQGIKSTIPIKLNQAGVIPIIFAISLISFPTMIFQFLSQMSDFTLSPWMEAIANFSQSQYPFIFALIFFILVFFFTFFYTAVTFDPRKMAENLAKGGTYIPGVRPGEDTEEYLGKITTRVTFFGALFLAFVAILPIIVAQVTGEANLFVGGTSILIVVSVGIDLIRKVNAQISVREYLHSV